METIYRKVDKEEVLQISSRVLQYLKIELKEFKLSPSIYNNVARLLTELDSLQPVEPQEPKCEECPSRQFYEANTAKIMDKIEQPEISVTDEEIEKYARNEFDKYYRVMGTFGPYFQGVKDCAKWMRDKLKANG